MMCVISCYVGPRYNGTLLYVRRSFHPCDIRKCLQDLLLPGPLHEFLRPMQFHLGQMHVDI